MSESFKIGGKITVNRLGFGAMQITGPGVWGPPRDKAEALRVLKRLPELGINFIDTADSYGPDVSEQLIREALHPYKGLLIATKAGFTRSGPNMWHINCRPEHLIASAKKSREKLGVEQIALWQLAPHRFPRAARRAVRRGEAAAGRGRDRPCRPVGSLGRRHQAGLSRSFRWPRCRTATTWPTATATMWWIIARPMASALFPIIRWATAIWPGRAGRWTSWPRPRALRRGRWLWPGC